jgi:hypothetical protein
MKQGDKVCVVSGLGVPIILRSSNDQDDSYKVVGAAYAFDLMHGEVADLAKAQDGWLKESWIHLT